MRKRKRKANKSQQTVKERNEAIQEEKETKKEQAKEVAKEHNK
jgi:hypothetical protein